MTQLSNGQSLATRFTLIRHLGRGGMGDVWLARDAELGSEVVTKIIPANATPEQISLLRQECRNARRLSHPYIVRVFDFHQDPQASFITMEYAAGGDLCELRGGSPKQIAQTLLPLVDALQYAHHEGVIHRDLKCSNVLIDQAGRPRLSDFGIAGLATPGPLDLQISGGGSGHHASPQQMAGEPPSPADDIYGLGIMLRDLLGPDQALPEGIGQLISRMTAPAVEDRLDDLAQVRTALTELATFEEVSTVPPRIARNEIRLSPPPRVPAVRPVEAPAQVRETAAVDPTRKWHPHWLATITAFLVLVAAVFAVFFLLPKWVQQRPSADVAVADDPDPVEIAEDLSEISPREQGSRESSKPNEEPPVVETTESEAADLASADRAVEENEAPAIAELQSKPVEKVRPATTPPAATGPARPKVDPTSRAFAEAMSSGLAAFEVGDYVTAQKAFEQAVALSPESAEAADGLARAQQEQRLIEIARHREKALSLEQAERWREAEDEYKATLALDSTLRFARQGEARTSSRARLNDELTYHIAHPDRLVEDRVLEEARRVLAEAETVDTMTPGLQQQIADLRQIVETASTLVQVTLVSDNSTEIVVYRIGRLGRFERRQLELRPGTYTVVGTRDGYRDVRRQLKVEAEGQSQPLSVRCEEKI